MKRLGVLLALLGLLCVGRADAFWQSRDSNYNISVGGAPANPVLTFVGSGTMSGTTTAVSDTNANIGNPTYIGTRLVVLLIQSSSSFSLTAITINGVSVNLSTNAVQATAPGALSVVATAVVPSGTTGVTISATSTGVFGGVNYAVYNSDNSLLLSNQPLGGGGTNFGASTNSISATFSETINGFVVGTVSHDNAGTRTQSIPGYSIDASGFGFAFFSQIPVASTGTGTATDTWTGATSTPSIAVAALR